jgi:hypothetical protein
MLSELGETIRTGEPQSHRVFGMGWWDWLNANPNELATFGEAMKANSQNSMCGVLEKCDFRNAKKIADLGGGFGHLVIALLEKYPSLHGILVDLPELIPVAREKNPTPEAGIGVVGIISSVQDTISIARTIRAAVVSLSVSFASWEKSVEDQQELLAGKAFKSIPIQVASLAFVQVMK